MAGLTGEFLDLWQGKDLGDRERREHSFPRVFLKRYDSKGVRGWWSANNMIPWGLAGKGRGDLNTEFAENTEIPWSGRRPSWGAKFKEEGSSKVNACQG